MIVSISEAARRVGRTRQTLYAMRDRGALSFTTDPLSGASAIDVAELCRVFPFAAQNSMTTEKLSNAQQSMTTENLQPVVEAMKAHIASLELLLAEKDMRLKLLEDLRTGRSIITPSEASVPKRETVRRARGLLDRLAEGLKAALR